MMMSIMRIMMIGTMAMTLVMLMDTSLTIMKTRMTITRTMMGMV